MVRLIVPDKITAVTAAQAMTAALLARERTGRGQHVRLSMLDAMIAFLWPEGMSGHTFIGDEARVPRTALSQDLVFETSDGYITTGAVSDAEWLGLARATEHPEWLEDPRFATPAGRLAHMKERLDLMAEALRARPSADWLQRLDAEGVPCAPILTRGEVLTHPQVAANDLIVESVHPHAGPMRQTRPAARFDATPATIRRPAPMLGEHTDEVLGELGLSRDQITALREATAVG